MLAAEIRIKKRNKKQLGQKVAEIVGTVARQLKAQKFSKF